MKNVIVIPCYNEAKRLQINKFQEFLETEKETTLCFVNDGSKDNTQMVLQGFRKGNKGRVVIIDLPENRGKAEAVRTGMIQMTRRFPFAFVGFMDADLSTSFEEYMNLVSEINASKGRKKLVFGSRNAEKSQNIDRNFFRKLLSGIVGMMIRIVLKLPISDTQCGAKVFSPDMARVCFKSQFVTRWLFDVEIFIRMKKYYSKNKMMNLIQEVPLKKWVHVEDSKITLKDSIKIPGQLCSIAANYHLKPGVSAFSTNMNKALMGLTSMF